MPLPVELGDIWLPYSCPHCGHRFEKRGAWFVSVSSFRCETCRQKVHLTYPAKIELFENYLGSLARSLRDAPS
jgi:DNA-directed RNA polymerase subunit RPC12/RpoP